MPIQNPWVAKMDNKHVVTTVPFNVTRSEWKRQSETLTETEAEESPHWPPTMSKVTRLLMGMMALIPIAGLIVQSMNISVGPLLVFFYFLLLLFFGGYLVHNPRLDTSSKVAWGAGFIFLGPVTLPAYWYLYVWRDPQP